jgi:DNA-directed RNA polymerase specialized sigma24 family protein
MLIHGLGWSYSEVAELLGVSKGTVQTQTGRGVARLRRQIGVSDDK